MADAEDQDDQAIVFDLADETVVADAIFPELSDTRAAQSLADAAWIVEVGDAFMEELQDALGVRGVELGEFAVGRRGKLNVVGHGAS